MIYSDLLVTNSYGESWDSSYKKSWDHVHKQWAPVENNEGS